MKGSSSWTRARILILANAMAAMSCARGGGPGSTNELGGNPTGVPRRRPRLPDVGGAARAPRGRRRAPRAAPTATSTSRACSSAGSSRSRRLLRRRRARRLRRERVDLSELVTKAVNDYVKSPDPSVYIPERCAQRPVLRAARTHRSGRRSPLGLLEAPIAQGSPAALRSRPRPSTADRRPTPEMPAPTETQMQTETRRRSARRSSTRSPDLGWSRTSAAASSTSTPSASTRRRWTRTRRVLRRRDRAPRHARRDGSVDETFDSDALARGGHLYVPAYPPKPDDGQDAARADACTTSPSSSTRARSGSRSRRTPASTRPSSSR